MVKSCPECGSVSEDDASFCTRCGRMLERTVGNVAVPSTSSADAATVVHGGSAAPYVSSSATGKKGLTAIIVSIVLLAGVGGISIAAVGGAASFEVDYEDDDFIFRNTSIGVFQGYMWTVQGEDGTVQEFRTSTGSSLTWSSESMYGDFTMGLYVVTLHAYTLLGMEQTCFENVLEDGVRGYDVKWMYGGSEQTVHVSMYLSEYYDYKDHTFRSVSRWVDPRWPGSAADQALVREYMQTDSEHDAFDSIVSQLKASSPVGEEAQINYLMGFVQSLDGNDTYKSDLNSKGQPTEYWNFPMETLFNKGGDCEDLAMLLMALCLSFFDDADVALVLFWGNEYVDGHAMASVAMETPPSSMNQVVDPDYIVNGTTYYVCETTSKGWNVGMISPEYLTITPDDLIIV